MICVFWPIGLYLLVKRISLDKKAAMVSSKLIKGLGIASCAMAALGLLVLLSDGFDSSSLIAVLFFGGAGAALLYYGNKIKKDAQKVKQYIAIIVNGGERQIDEIARATSKPYNTVRVDLQKMIDKGFLKNAYINESTREIVLTTPEPVSAPATETSYTETVAATPADLRVVACPCCGANNTISGTVGECEYCGSPLS